VPERVEIPVPKRRRPCPTHSGSIFCSRSLQQARSRRFDHDFAYRSRASLSVATHSRGLDLSNRPKCSNENGRSTEIAIRNKRGLPRSTVSLHELQAAVRRNCSQSEVFPSHPPKLVSTTRTPNGHQWRRAVEMQSSPGRLHDARCTMHDAPQPSGLAVAGPQGGSGRRPYLSRSRWSLPFNFVAVPMFAHDFGLTHIPR
jgi:hypothetical protein